MNHCYRTCNRDRRSLTPVKVPARPIPFHYLERVYNQLQEMAQEGIIRHSNSPWCAPAVYVLKSNGEIRVCVDFVQLYKVTKKMFIQFLELRIPNRDLQTDFLQNRFKKCLLEIPYEPYLH